MKIDIEFTHRGWFYGCPVYLAFEGEGVFPIPIVPLTGWWITHIATVIQAIQSVVAGAMGIDSECNGGFIVERTRELRRPFVRTFDWPEEAVRAYRGG